MRRLLGWAFIYMLGYMNAHFTATGNTLESAITAVGATGALMFAVLSREVIRPETQEVAEDVRGLFGLKKQEFGQSVRHHAERHGGKSYDCTQCKTR